MSTSLTQQLTTLLGPDAVLPAAGYAVDGVVPQAVVRPDDRRGVAEALAWAAKNGVAVSPRGGGVLAGLGNIPHRVDVVLDLTGLNRVIDYQPADLTVTAEAGITLETLRRELAQGDKFVPLEAPLPHRATIGGILAANFSGPWRHSYGLPRDWLIGITVLGIDGIATKAGGRVVKNVTGYDLNKLYTGSLGTLGVIIEASFKLAPLPDTHAGLVAYFSSTKVAVSAARSLVSQVYAPQGIQVVNRPVAERLGLALPTGREAVVLAFLAGRPRATSRRRDDAARLLSDCGGIGLDLLDDSSSANLLSNLTDLPWASATVPTLGLKVNLPPSNVGQLLESITDAVELGIIADPGFGAVQLLRWPDGSGNNLEPVAIMDMIESVRQAARNLNGTAVVESCPLDVKSGIDVWAGSAGASELEIMRRIKQKFDPAGILNPGRFVGRL